MRTRTGKTVLIVLMVLLLAVIMQHVVGNHPKHLANTAGPVSAPKQAQTPAPSPTPAATPAPKESLPAKPKKRKAVDAAVTDLQVVFSAQFLAPDQMQKSLKAILVPSLLPTYLKQLPKSGDALARSWGYTSTYDALANASIQVETQKYKVYRFTHSRADIMLYSVTYFKGRQVQKVDGEDTVQYYQYHVPAITIVKMRWVDGRWLYAGYADPSASQAPVFTSADDHLTYDETTRRYLPYLEDYTTYVYHTSEKDGR
jgi:hypothetical protein